MPSKFGGLLARAREEKKITLRKLGKLVGLSPSFLSEMEMGNRLPPKNEETIRDIALVLNIDEEDMIEAARMERAKKAPKFFERIFNANQELAWGLYRESEDANEEDLQEAFEKALEILKKRGG